MAGFPREKFQHAFELRQYVDAMSAADEARAADMTVAYEAAAKAAALHITPLVSRMILENWKARGFSDRTGTMAENLSRVEVHARVSGGKVQLRVFMPTGGREKNYRVKTAQGKVKEKSVFTVAGALNYGSVRFPASSRDIRDTVTGALVSAQRRTAPVGAAAKRTIKKLALTGRISKRAASALANGYRRKDGTVLTRGLSIGSVEATRQTASGTVVRFSGGPVVIPGRDFFFLTTRQRSVLGWRFLEYFTRRLGLGSASSAALTA